MQLSPHFSLEEFTRSSTALSRGIDNTPSTDVVSNLQHLCVHILEPLRSFANTPEGKSSSSSEVPIIISSGYRSSLLNTAVGGSKASQHMTGEACDIHIPKTTCDNWNDSLAHTDMEIAQRWFMFLEHHTDFDQLILETANGNDYWIHVSCRKNICMNRHQVIRKLRKGG